MAIATVELPDGRTAQIEVPDGMTPEAIEAEVGAMFDAGEFQAEQAGSGYTAQSAPPQAPRQPEEPWYEPLMLQSSRDRAQMPQREDASSSPTLRVLGELAATANRSVTELVDFFGPGAINALLSVSGSEPRVPTLTGALASTGIEGGFMEPGRAREVVQAGGNLIAPVAGLKPVARQAGDIGSAFLDLVGAGSSSITQPVAQGTRLAAQAVSDSLPSLGPSKAARAAELPLKRGTGDVSTFGFRLDEAGKVVADPRQGAAAKQGFEEGLVSMVNAAGPLTRSNMRTMLDVVEKGKQNFRSQAISRPLDVVGDSITNRVKVIKNANRAAGSRLDGVAKSLQGQSVDVSPAMNNLAAKLDDIGVKLDVQPGSVTVDFDGSDIEGLDGPIKVVNNMLKRLANTKAPDAYDVHRMKRYIDENVTYGKGEGLSGRVEGIFKTLRRELDGILDEQFPAYNRVNTQYAETIGALDALQDVAGKKVNITGDNADKALGTLSRRLLSNAQSRVPLMDALEQADQVAKKYATSTETDIVPYRRVMERAGVDPASLDDDLVAQVMFVDELEKTFGTGARTSLQGDVGKVIDRGIDTTIGGQTMYGAAADLAKTGWRKARGINEENALKSLRELLRD